MFKKRSGTSGIRGQLYETKLISLIHFRAKHNDVVDEIYLASNVDEVGAFDDICFKVKIKGHDKPLVVFIQAKHRDSEKSLHIHNKGNLIKYFNSYLEICKKFKTDQVKDLTQERIFDENVNNIDYNFIIYTNEKEDMNKILKRSSFDLLHNLIATGRSGYHLKYTKEDEESLCKVFINNEMKELAARFSEFINNKPNEKMMVDELILRYHVILAQNVVNISDITPEGHRVCTFRQDFFDTQNEFLVTFRDKLYEAKYQTRILKKTEMQPYLLKFLSNPCESFLYNIIGSVIIYKNSRFEFSTNTPEEIRDNERLSQITLSESIVKQVIAKVAKNILLLVKFKVPPGFGNRDLVIRGKESKVERRLDYLTASMVKLIKEYRYGNIVNITENVCNGLFRHNGGFGSTIGNILVYDSNSKLIKFADNLLIQNYSKRLLTKLLNEIDYLYDLRFNIKVENLPKLTIEGDIEDYARDFLNKLVLYTEQGNEKDVENILRKEIGETLGPVNNLKIKCEAILLKYHNEIQKWSQLSKEAFYLTKASDIYEQAVTTYVNEPVISMLNMLFINKLNTVEFTYSETAIDYLQNLNRFFTTIIVTDDAVLTAVKVIQCLKPEYIVLDLHYISKISTNELNTLISVLNEINKNYSIIIVCDNSLNIRNVKIILTKIVDIINGKKVIIIVHKQLEGVIKNYFQQIDHLLDDTKRNFLDLSEDSQNDLLEKTSVIFQGQEMYLKSIVDNVSIQFMQGTVLNDIMLNKGNKISIGEYVGKYNYKEAECLYVNRRVCRNAMREDDNVHKVLKTFYDLNDQVIIITGKPGMGKSTLLTHLSLNTKKVRKNDWIVRINLLEYASEFYKWKKNKVVVDILISLKFICQSIFKNKVKDSQKLTINLSVINNEISLEDCTGDHWIQFELKLFLHFFNKRKLIFLFDGFDEICPFYMHEVISFLNIIKNQPQRHKMWITSRSNAAIKSILEKKFGISYKLDNFDYEEQAIYLQSLWDNKFNINNLDDEHQNNLDDFLNFMVTVYEEMSENNFIDLYKSLYFPILRVYSHFEDYLRIKLEYLPRQDKRYRTNIVTDSLKILFRFLEKREAYETMIKFSGNPLHLNLTAAYLLNNLKHKNEWNIYINAHTLYEEFVEAKIKIIKFEDKNKMNTCNPDIQVLYEKERLDFMAKHKTLAAYSLLYMNGFDVLNKRQLKDIKQLINLINNGKYKSEFICDVINDIPQFVHLTFAKYFAVEFLCDRSKTGDRNEKQRIFHDLLEMHWSRVL